MARSLRKKMAKNQVMAKKAKEKHLEAFESHQEHRTSIHEAGHAVAYLADPAIDLLEITLGDNKDVSNFGNMNIVDSKTDGDVGGYCKVIVDQNNISTLGLCMTMGGMAEHYIAGTPMVQVKECMSGDIDILEQYGVNVQDSVTKAIDFLHNNEEVWNNIIKVAKELRIRRKLTREEILEIIRR